MIASFPRYSEIFSFVQPNQMTSEKAVCPESTIESGIQRNFPSKRLAVSNVGVGKGPSKNEGTNKFACESTIESANRRNFVKKAAVVTAAVATGGALLDKNPIKESQARTSGLTCNCILSACCGIYVNTNNNNPGRLYCYCSQCEIYTAWSLFFGTYLDTGEGIASARTCGAPNRNGLDFYTDYSKRVSITHCGQVGIGTTAPHCDVLAQVNGPFLALSTQTGAAIHGCATSSAKTAILGSGGPCTVPFVAKGTSSQKADLQQWNKVNTIKSVVSSCGYFGIGTCSPSPYALKVIAPNQDGIRVEGPSSCVGAAISFQTINPCVQGWEILDTGATSSQGAGKLNIRNLTTSKDVFTICGPSSYIGINNTAPRHTVCVSGTIFGCGGTATGVEGCSDLTGVRGSGQLIGVQGYSPGGIAVSGCSPCNV